MAKKIRIDLNDPRSAVEEIEMFIRSIEYNADKLCMRLALEAQDEAEDKFGNARPDLNPTTVSNPIKIPNGYKIQATGINSTAKDGTKGNSVVFAEFGSGTYASSHPLASEYGAFPGSWSMHDAQQFSSKGRWYYEGERFEYIMPSKAMYHAALKARMSVIPIAKEVFG